MSSLEPALSSGERGSFGAGDASSPLNLGVIAGVALLALGAALFALGIFHGFENGSCSTTGYTAHYGPVQHCGKGVGWWMLILTAGLLVAGGGATLSGTRNTLSIPVLFVAIGAPFVALALRSGNSHLLIGSSSSTGKLSAGIFGAGFVIAGAVWGVIAARGSVSHVSAASRFANILAALVGVGLGLAIAAGVAGAIGPATPTGVQRVSRSVGRGSGSDGRANAATRQASAATRQANAAIAQATAQADKAAKLGACVTAAGTDTARIQACEAKYMP